MKETDMRCETGCSFKPDLFCSAYHKVRVSQTAWAWATVPELA